MVITVLVTVIVMGIAFAMGPDEEPQPDSALSDHQLYDIPYQVCGADPAGVFAEAGTQDPVAAARWYAAGLTGDAAIGGYEGCLDALNGAPNRFAGATP